MAKITITVDENRAKIVQEWLDRRERRGVVIHIGRNVWLEKKENIAVDLRAVCPVHSLYDCICSGAPDFAMQDNMKTDK